MEKPLSIAIHDLKKYIAETIEDSKLPPCILQPIIYDFLIQIQFLSQKQLEEDLRKYNSLSEQKEAQNGKI